MGLFLDFGVIGYLEYGPDRLDLVWEVAEVFGDEVRPFRGELSIREFALS